MSRSVDESMLSGNGGARLPPRRHPAAGSVLVQAGPAAWARVGSATRCCLPMLRLIARRWRYARAWHVTRGLAAGLPRLSWRLTSDRRRLVVVDPARAPGGAGGAGGGLPCAFAPAVPTALTRALAVLARQGALVVRADALERLCRVRRVLFDKTGTAYRETA